MLRISKPSSRCARRRCHKTESMDVNESNGNLQWFFDALVNHNNPRWDELEAWNGYLYKWANSVDHNHKIWHDAESWHVDGWQQAANYERKIKSLSCKLSRKLLQAYQDSQSEKTRPHFGQVNSCTPVSSKCGPSNRALLFLPGSSFKSLLLVVSGLVK